MTEPPIDAFLHELAEKGHDMEVHESYTDSPFELCATCKRCGAHADVYYVNGEMLPEEPAFGFTCEQYKLEKILAAMVDDY